MRQQQISLHRNGGGDGSDARYGELLTGPQPERPEPTPLEELIKLVRFWQPQCFVDLPLLVRRMDAVPENVRTEDFTLALKHFDVARLRGIGIKAEEFKEDLLEVLGLMQASATHQIAP